MGIEKTPYSTKLNIFQLTWTCHRCGKKGNGPRSDVEHYKECIQAESRERINKIDGFISETKKKGEELREIKSRFMKYVNNQK